MKSFKHYLMESIRTYDYKIKIAGEPESKWVDNFCYNLAQKFDAVKISEPKRTPIQKEPYGFPGLKNSSITIITCNFRYPVIEPMIKQMAKLLGYDENKVRLIQSSFDDSMNTENEHYENQMSHSPVLDHSELEDNGKEANKEYANQYLDKIKSQMNDNKKEMDFASKEKQETFDPFKMPTLKDNSSPFSHITRGSKPKTSNTR